MSKRIVATSVGLLAVLASVIAGRYAIEAADDFRNPAVSFWFAALGDALMWSIALYALAMGIRFLRFAWSGKSNSSSGWARPVLLGTGFFFPGFFFSLPLTMLWAKHTWTADGQRDLAAIQVSFYVGIAAAVICCIVLLKTGGARHKP